MEYIYGNKGSNPTVFPLGLQEEVSQGLRRGGYWLSKSPWKALSCWSVNGMRPSFRMSRQRPAFSQFLYSSSFRRNVNSSRPISALLPDEVKTQQRGRAMFRPRAQLSPLAAVQHDGHQMAVCYRSYMMREKQVGWSRETTL